MSARELSAVDVARYFIARVERLNPVLNAIVQFDPEAVLAQAQDIVRRLAAGEQLPMAGVPISIKDNIWVQALRDAGWAVEGPAGWAADCGAPF